MTNSPAILDAFVPISLREMDTVKLLDRLDVKFMFRREQLEEILEQCLTEYRVLSVAGSRFSRYQTRYFDTPGMEMYTCHHNGRLNRHKVRFRDYIDSGLSFFEVKLKTNKGRTIKDRIIQKNHTYKIEGESETLLRQKTAYNASMLKQVLQVNYNRITLVRKNLTERLTIDFDMSFHAQDQEKPFQNLVIAEVKQDKAGRSPFITLMRSNFIQTHSLSKYCLGIACLNPDVKINNFKPKLLFINKLCHDNK